MKKIINYEKNYNYTKFNKYTKLSFIKIEDSSHIVPNFNLMCFLLPRHKGVVVAYNLLSAPFLQHLKSFYK
ncbi:hypothetical protein Avbf_12702 [Armadillidium vulgare]|nr:hypothetical protein Avbf_12702 [Armadillidium vulgare]